MGVTAGGYVGFADAGKAHVSIGVAGVDCRSGDLPSAHSAVGSPGCELTWLEEGILGLVVAEDPDIVVYAVGELRNGQQAGLTPRPPID